MIEKEHLEVVQQREIAESVFEAELYGSLVAQMTVPGQFVHLRVTEGTAPLLRRPISLCDVDVKERKLKIIYRRQGEGTKQLARLRAGDTVDVLGPLGHGFPTDLPEGRSALLIGGGVGVPPLYYLAKQLKNQGIAVRHILGFDTMTSVFYEKEFAALGPTTVTTVDGTYGMQGLVTDALQADVTDSEADRIYSCGPTPMLRALEQALPNKELYVSLEERMGCGVGACLACVCQTYDGGTSYKKICTDGPVFRAGEVVL
ncbi:dihydroorotate dehydrogenase electron transfer subunit [Bacillaceae bacterium SIJ1]|uniref:dihydroorotate dehydrogenase electron transfer subunit n=1 Tax=Litoribacterium kuwaitense TaxID=1398745 RepID=UPI0013EE3541|nr:dihydroorotate dehydrogenase electron transfer subunit [Litoribacterium kuwaitense]NGP44316.1 dihydroorotate dehydrogenase electron transfer subunit [Litoribacterium kuwaitense]